MESTYPGANNCTFLGFPDYLAIRVGSLLVPYLDGASVGTRINLLPTPKSGVLQGTLTIGGAIPLLEMIYSDTGSDDNFVLKLSFFGTYAFYKYLSTDAHFRFLLRKGIRIEAGELSQEFQDVIDCQTKVTSHASTIAAFPHPIAVTGLTEATTGALFTLFVGSVETTCGTGWQATVDDGERNPYTVYYDESGYPERFTII